MTIAATELESEIQFVIGSGQVEVYSLKETKLLENVVAGWRREMRPIHH